MARNSDGTFASKQHLDRFDHQRQLQMKLREVLTTAADKLDPQDALWGVKVMRERPDWAVPVIERIEAELAVDRLTGGCNG